MSRQFPPASIDQVLGLLRVLYSLGGKTDIYKIDEEVEIDFDELSLAVNAAEALGLVAVRAGDVELTELGRRAAVSDLDDVKEEIALKLSSLRPFADILNKVDGDSAPLSDVLSLLCDLGYCGEVAARRIIAWAVRFGLIEVTPEDVVLPGRKTA